MSLPPDLAAELVALVTSALLLIGIALIAPIFFSIRGSEEALRASEVRYRGVVEAFPDAVVVVDLDGQITMANQQAVNQYGCVSEEDLVGRDSFKMIVTEDQPHEIQILQDNLEFGKIMNIEYPLVKKDGSTFPAEISVSVIRDPEGIPQAFISVIRDITERKQAEEKIRKSEASLAEAQRIAGLGSWEVDRVKNELVWSDEVYRIFGCTQHEFPVSHEKFMSFVHPDDQEHIQRAIDEAVYEDKPYSIDHRIILLDGSERIVHEEAEVTRDETGRAIRMVGTIHDITNRMRAEEALKESETKFRMLFESAPVAIVLTDHNGNFIAANEWMETISGYSKKELEVVKAPAHYVHEEDRNNILSELDETGNLRDFEVKLRQKNGMIYHALLNEDLIELEGKKINLATIRDITEQKRAEESIRLSEQRYRTLFKHSPVSIWIEDFTAVAQLLDKLRANGVSDLDTHLDNHPEVLLEAISLIRVIDVNDATLEMYEVDTKEGLLDSMNQLLSEVPPEHFRQELLAIWENKIDRLKFEVSAITLKGNPLQIIVRWKAPVIDGRMDLSRVIVTITDITKRKKAEHDLKAAADTAMLYLDLMGHDIRNHLQAIIMGMEIMAHMEIGAEAEQVFEIVYESVNKSQAMIGKIQSTRGLLTESVSARSLSEVLNKCLRSLRATHDDVEVELNMQVQEPVVRADEYLEFLLMNILENAVVHNDKRIRQVWVTVKDFETGYEVLISDNGPGIVESKKEVLFDPERRFGGVGVHQAMSIAHKYGGRVSVHDRIAGNPSQGAEFLIWFPKWI
ncbi:MAG: PAS domain S-box protein [Candidatus Thorarchaeota archaeon]